MGTEDTSNDEARVETTDSQTSAPAQQPVAAAEEPEIEETMFAIG